jgi:anti-anti-sigma factor
VVATEGRIEAARQEGVTVLDLLGEHDMSTVRLLEARLLREAAQGHDVVVSLQNAEFIDSMIVAALYRAHRELLARNLRLALYSDDSAVVSRILSVTGLDEEVHHATTLDSAIAIARGTAEAPGRDAG